MNDRGWRRQATRRIGGVRFIHADKALEVVGGSRSRLYVLARQEGWRAHREGRFVWYAEADVRRTAKDERSPVQRGWDRRRAHLHALLGDGWLVVAEAGKAGLTPESLHRRIEEGVLPAAKRLGMRVVRKADLAALAARLAAGRRLKGHLSAEQARAFAARVRACAALSAREREILRSRYGLDGRPPMSLEAVGREFGITRQAVHHIETRALKKVGGPPR